MHFVEVFKNYFENLIQEFHDYLRQKHRILTVPKLMKSQSLQSNFERIRYGQNALFTYFLVHKSGIRTEYAELAKEQFVNFASIQLLAQPDPSSAVHNNF